jgi:PEP-CTERM motif
MKLSSPQFSRFSWFSGAIVAFAAILFSFVRPALADSYTIVDLGDDKGGIYGIDTAGDVVTYSGSGCAASMPVCYITYVDGVATSEASSAPDLVYDDGTPCSSNPAGFNVSHSVCNNGLIGLGSFYNPNGDPNGVYLGSLADLQFIHTGTADQVFLNSVGDFAWTDGQDDELFEAIANPSPVQPTFFREDFVESTTPEPASLLLVGTGLLYFTAALRRKANR